MKWRRTHTFKAIWLGLWLLCSFFGCGNTEEPTVARLEAQRIIWGKTDCLDKVVISPKHWFYANCEGKLLKGLGKHRIPEDPSEFLFRATLSDFQLIGNLEENTSFQPVSKYSYFLRVRFSDGSEISPLISEVLLDYRGRMDFKGKLISLLNDSFPPRTHADHKTTDELLEVLRELEKSEESP